jgi:16S rRNA (cytidine1402-2'-O)-methyltransferase
MSNWGSGFVIIEFKEDNRNMFGTLYIVATPIGNLEDVSLRATAILSDVDIVLAEDTRVTRKLVKFVKTYDSKLKTKDLKDSLLTTRYPQLISYHQHSSEKRKLEILRYLVEGKNIALVTDAGTPGISDPGNELIAFLLEKEPSIKVVPIPGPSAVTTALSVSGFRSDKYLFLGYFPRKKKSKVIKLIKFLVKPDQPLAGIKFPIVFFESSRRILKTLRYLEGELGANVQVLVARELTKIHETMYRGSIKTVTKLLDNELLSKNKIKGEIVVVVDRTSLQGQAL